MRKREDGEFWMCMEDFQLHFNQLDICNLTPDLLSKQQGKKWTVSLYHGRWVKGSSAGGRIDHSTFWMNPQYCITLTSPDRVASDTDTCRVSISLIQKPNSKHRNRVPYLYIGITLYKVGDEHQPVEEKLSKEFFTSNSPVNKAQVYTNKREYSERFHLSPGIYALVPSTMEPNQQSNFLLRIYFHRHNHTE
nr:PREDICTED: calpain-9 [Latimeria chalumnae]|eukprot:XP_014352839.1 PREDICTED: calpain-9 [Latimeria chalumnae]